MGEKIVFDYTPDKVRDINNNLAYGIDRVSTDRFTIGGFRITWNREIYDYYNNHPLVKTVYDWSRQSLNFEINLETGQVQPIDIDKPNLQSRWNACINKYHHDVQYSLDPETGEVVQELRVIQKTDIKYVRFTIGGMRDRLHEMAFDRPIEQGKEGVGKNLEVKRKAEIEEWAMDCYQWICGFFKKENILTFVVHLDEITPHIHCDVVPLVDGALSYNRMVQLNHGKAAYNRYMKKMHDTFMQEVCEKWGMEYADEQEQEMAEHNKKIQGKSTLERKNYRTLLTRMSKLAEKLEQGLIDYATYEQMRNNYQAKMDAILDE